MVGPGVSEAARDLGVLDSSEGVNTPAGDDFLLTLETALSGPEFTLVGMEITLETTLVGLEITVVGLKTRLVSLEMTMIGL